MYGETRSCFLALERAADSLFLVIRLCLLSPLLSSESWPLFFPKQPNIADSSKWVSMEWGLKLITVAGGARREPWWVEEDEGGGSWFKGLLRKSWKMELLGFWLLNTGSWSMFSRRCWWSEARFISFHTSSIVTWVMFLVCEREWDNEDEVDEGIEKAL